jgi:D-sedoheptulose 7-phosphate isomerase
MKERTQYSKGKEMDNNTDIIKDIIRESIATKERILGDESFLKQIDDAACAVFNSLNRGGKIVLAGNGGSAADCIHIAGELVGRFQQERNAWPAIALNADVATLTAIANDYGYENVFLRQVEGIVNENDVFIGISTSGNSENIIRAVKKSNSIGAITICLTGTSGGRIRENVDICLRVPSDNTARIQESHIMIGHIICQIVEMKMMSKNDE